MDEHPGLLRDGLDIGELKDLLEGRFKQDLVVDVCEGFGAEVRSFVQSALRQGAPTILGLNWADGGHWVLAVGTDEEIENDGSSTLCRFLVLDPSEAPLNVCPWNGLVDARGSGGPYPYEWWTGGEDGRRVAFDGALALHPL